MFSKFCKATRRDSFKVMLSPVKFVFNSLKLVPVGIQVFGLKEVYICIAKTRRGVMPVIHDLAVFKQNVKYKYQIIFKKEASNHLKVTESERNDDLLFFMQVVMMTVIAKNQVQNGNLKTKG